MLKRVAPLIVVVFAANVAALGMAARNRSGPPDATLRLTERELRVTNFGTDTTGMTLTLQWDRRAILPWFDRAKLESLGFDCSTPVDAPGAVDHYSGPILLPRAVYVVFEYDGPAAPTDPYASRLRPVDVGLDPQALRSRYGDRERYLITAGTVRPTLDQTAANGRPPLLRGQVLWVDPTQVYVPQEMQPTIVAAVGNDVRPPPEPSRLNHPPRYEVQVEYGRSWLPRVTAIRPLR